MIDYIAVIATLAIVNFIEMIVAQVHISNILDIIKDMRMDLKSIQEVLRK